MLTCNLERKSKIKDFVYEFLKKKPATYHLNGKLQCDANRNRSFSDLYALCKTYYPSITHKKLAKILMELRKQDKRVYFSYCYTIHKPVVIYMLGPMPDMCRSNNRYAIGTDGWRISDIEKLAQ